MKEYVCLWHIGNHTRGEIVKLDDDAAERLMKRGAIRPVKCEPEKAAAEEPAEKPEKEPVRKAKPESAKKEPEPEPEPETKAEEDEEEPEAPVIDALEMVGEAEPEAPKPERKTRKTGRKGAKA
jgi:hypothetical protein